MKVWQSFLLMSHMFFAAYLTTIEKGQYGLIYFGIAYMVFGLFIGGLTRGQL